MFLNRWFLMCDNTVVNVIVFNGGDWSPPEGHTIMQEVEGVGIGWKLIDGNWIAPPSEVNEVTEGA